VIGVVCVVGVCEQMREKEAENREVAVCVDVRYSCPSTRCDSLTHLYESLQDSFV